MAVVIALAVVAGSFALTSTALHLRTAQSNQRYDFDAGQDEAATLLGLYLDEETGVRGYLLGLAPALLQPYKQAKTQVAHKEAELREHLASDPAAEKLVAQVVDASTAWSTKYATPALAAVAAGHVAEERRQGSVLDGKDLFDGVRNGMTKLTARIAVDQRTNESRIGILEDRLEALLVISLVAAIAVLVALVLITRRNVIRPLEALGAAARQVAEGELLKPVRAEGPAEIGRLGADLEAMRSRLVVEIDRARAAGEALAHDSPTVTALAEALRPRIDELPPFEIAGRLDPAEGVLAGDWFDVIRLRDQLAIVVGDVSGHGPASAVLALRLRSTLDASLRAGAPPEDALRTSAISIADDSPDYFATVLALVIDLPNRVIRYANAGHPAALLHSRELSHMPSWTTLAQTGPLLSPIVADWGWGAREEAFPPGAGLLVYTDGAVEARNSAGEMYGAERVRQTVAAGTGASPTELISRLANDIAVFTSGVVRDDRTYVYCYHRPPGT
jgi:CHASE3 domain sensor protein